MSVRLLVASFLVTMALGCRSERQLGPVPSPPPEQRDELLDRILTLAEVEPCLVDAGAPAVRLVDAELAGEAATATFVCSNGAARGRVTFFRVGGVWKVSTKEISTSTYR